MQKNMQFANEVIKAIAPYYKNKKEIEKVYKTMPSTYISYMYTNSDIHKMIDNFYKAINNHRIEHYSNMRSLNPDKYNINLRSIEIIDSITLFILAKDGLKKFIFFLNKLNVEHTISLDSNSMSLIVKVNDYNVKFLSLNNFFMFKDKIDIFHELESGNIYSYFKYSDWLQYTMEEKSNKAKFIAANNRYYGNSSHVMSAAIEANPNYKDLIEFYNENYKIKL